MIILYAFIFTYKYILYMLSSQLQINFYHLTGAQQNKNINKHKCNRFSIMKLI